MYTFCLAKTERGCLWAWERGRSFGKGVQGIDKGVLSCFICWRESFVVNSIDVQSMRQQSWKNPNDRTTFWSERYPMRQPLRRDYVSILKNTMASAIFTTSTTRTSCWRENQSCEWDKWTAYVNIEWFHVSSYNYHSQILCFWLYIFEYIKIKTVNVEMQELTIIECNPQVHYIILATHTLIRNTQFVCRVMRSRVGHFDPINAVPKYRGVIKRPLAH